MRLSQELRSLVTATYPVVTQEGNELLLLSGSNVRQTYVEFLVLLHQIIRASVPLMEAAHATVRAASTQPSADTDLYLSYLAEHIEEEARHDEWLLEDLEQIGVSRRSVKSREPSPAVWSLVGSQYYLIHHHDAFGLLGYITVLEGFPPTMANIEHLQKVTGYPDAAFRTLRIHSEVDHTHGEELDKFLDKLEVANPTRRLIANNVVATIFGMKSCLSALRPAVEIANAS